MKKIFMIARVGALTSYQGVFATLQEAKEAAKNASLKHLHNESYIVFESVVALKATTSIEEVYPDGEDPEPVSFCNMSPRAKTTMRLMGIDTKDELSVHDFNEHPPIRIRGCGTGTANEIMSTAKSLGNPNLNN
jgi:hypothetical protein